MQKLQEMIDAAFGEQAKRAPQDPSQKFLKRERNSSEQAQQLKVLREARMSDDGSKQSLAFLLFEVVRHRGHWRVLHHNKRSTPHPDQLAAIVAAKQIARKKRELGHAVEVRLIRTDGQVVVQEVDTKQDG